jgi:hypothetical protein
MSSTNSTAKLATEVTESGEPIADVLGRVRSELDQIATSIDNMQAVVGELTWDLACQDPEYLKAMQSVDHSAQIVAGLGEFLVALVQDAPADWRLNPGAASKIVRLADLAARLATATPPDGKDDDSGDCELF